MNKFNLLIVFLVVSFSSFANGTITNVSLRYNGDQVVISYDLNSSNNNNLFDISVKLYRSKTDQIEAVTFTGDVGKSIASGTNKKAIWQVKVDNVKVNDYVYAVVEATPALNISIGKHLLKSALLPGLGEYRLDNYNLHIYKSVLGYGAIAGAIVLNANAVNNYDSYLSSTMQANNYFEAAQSQQVLSYVMAGTAVAVWGYGLYKTYTKAKKLKAYSTITINQSKYYYNFTNTAISGKSEQMFLEIKGKFYPPKLNIANGSLKFINSDNETINILNATENVKLVFTIENVGLGDAYEVGVNVKELKQLFGISYTENFILGRIKKGETKEIEISITTTLNLPTSLADFDIKIKEQNGFGIEHEAQISTKKFLEPKLQIVDYNVVTEKGGKAKSGERITLVVNIQNNGFGDAKKINIDFLNPSDVFSISGQKFQFDALKSGEHQTLVYEFIYNNDFKDSIIPIEIIVTESWKKFAENKKVLVSVNQDFSKKTTNFFGDVSVNTNIKPALLNSDVDINIPISKEKYQNKFAIVIGNEDYTSRQSDLSRESNVEFARADALIFKEYLIQTLGFESNNVFLLTDATASEIKQNINRLVELFKRIDAKESEIVFYYAGHGYPDEVSKTPYLMPVDVSVSNISSAIKLSDITETLAKTNAKRITIYLDACFTGEGRNAGLLAAARTARIKPKSVIAQGNMVIFSASGNEQTALPYREQKHGMFTYFLLKKLQETKGETKYLDLFNYIKDKVSLESTRTIKPQDPEILVSDEIKDKWENWKVK
jgi:hypothetical protein